MRVFTHKLHEQFWTPQHYITYSCGMLPNEIGDWYKNHVVKNMENNGGWKFEDDYSQYDSTQRRLLLEIE